MFHCVSSPLGYTESTIPSECKLLMAFLLCLFIGCLPLNHSHTHAADNSQISNKFCSDASFWFAPDNNKNNHRGLNPIWAQTYSQMQRASHSVSVSIFTRVFEELRQSASVTVTQMAHETPRCRSWETNHNLCDASADAQKSTEEERPGHLSLSLRVRLTLNVSGLKSGNVMETYYLIFRDVLLLIQWFVKNQKEV